MESCAQGMGTPSSAGRSAKQSSRLRLIASLIFLLLGSSGGIAYLAHICGLLKVSCAKLQSHKVFPQSPLSNRLKYYALKEIADNHRRRETKLSWMASIEARPKVLQASGGRGLAVCQGSACATAQSVPGLQKQRSRTIMAWHGIESVRPVRALLVRKKTQSTAPGAKLE